MTPSIPTVSIVVTTRNEEANIWNCLQSIALQDFQGVEICVVDNFSDDRTVEIAREFTDKNALYGPECSAQRNFGLTQLATGSILGFIDADMILGPGVVQSAVHVIQNGKVGAYIDEVTLGTSRLARVRRFERSIYSGTIIDCARFFTREAFLTTGGFDESLTGPEDWDFDKKLRGLGKVSLASPSEPVDLSTWAFHNECEALGVPRIRPNQIAHNEGHQTIRQYLAKKLYYGPGLEQYAERWPQGDRDVHRQLGWRYRSFLVHLEDGKWVKCVQRPFSTAQMFVLRFLTAVALIHARTRSRSCVS